MSWNITTQTNKQKIVLVQKQTLLSSCEISFCLLYFFGVKSDHDVFLTSVLRFAPSGSRNLFLFWRHKALSRKDEQETECELDLDQVLQEEFIARNQTYTRGPNRSCGKWAQLVRVWGERWGRPSPCDWCPAGGAERRGTPWTPGIWGTGPGSVSAADVDSEPLERTDPRLMSEDPQMMIRSRPEERDWSWLQSSHYSSGVNENRQVFPNPPRQQNEQEMMQANAVSVCLTCSVDAMSSVSLSAVDEISLLLEAASTELPLSAADELDSAWWPRVFTINHDNWAVNVLNHHENCHNAKSLNGPILA